MASIHGTSDSEVLVGTADADFINAYEGNDSIYAGADDVSGDTVWGGAGNDVFFGGAGNDYLTGEQGRDTIGGGDGNDSIAGDDRSGGESANGDNELWGGAGFDSIEGGDYDDTIGGGAGSDVLRGGDGNDIFYGGKDDGEDNIFAGGGNDTVYAGAGDDGIWLLDGSVEDVTSNLVFGGDGNDNINASRGADTIWGGAGDDTLSGSSAGTEFYYFAENSGNDVIYLFTTGQDIIDLSELGNFNSFNDVVSNASEFQDVGFTHTSIQLGTGSSVVIRGAEISDLSSADFVF